ncbi:hypothetical protein KZX50_11965 [Bacillus infantis]|uniref:hypothetical protein n=1 Tax=Bacillus infantis TaxID=324767 RepID=UPI000B9AD591|nr:hypothetical protein [Bacillus infantis]MCK6206161.1 hypothetical protein [Bacillus infantis]OXT16852.1 hypothetical protein B9K06_14290 [Bacillus sp. OG2]
MKNLLFFLFQMFLFTILLTINYFVDQFISSPFDSGDLFGIGEMLLLFVPLALLAEKVYKRYTDFRFFHKVLLSIPALAAAVLISGVVLGQIQIG